MFRRFIRQKNSVVFTWLLSYAFLLVIPVCVSILLYGQTKGIVDEQINHSNIFLLRRLQNQMDSVLGDARSLCVDMALDHRIRSLSSLTKLENKDYYDIYSVFTGLRSRKLSYDYINEYYIYYNNIDHIMTSRTSASSKEYYHAYYQGGDEDYQLWLDTISSQSTSRFHIIPSTHINGEDKLLFIFSVLSEVDASLTTNIIIEIDPEQFFNYAKITDTEEKGIIYIINSNNEIIYSTDPLEFNQNMYFENMVENNRLTYTELNGKKMTLSYTDSTLVDWKYVVAIPSGLFWKGSYDVRNMTILGVVIILFLGGILAYISINKNCTSLFHLVALLRGKENLDYQECQNEYAYIESAIHKTINENEELYCTLSRQIKELKSVFLANLIKGRAPIGMTLQDALSVYNIKFCSNQFAVIVFSIQETAEKSPELIREAIANTAAEYVSTYHDVHAADINDMAICMINIHKDRKKEWKQDLEKALRQVQEYIYSQYQVLFTASVSSIHETVQCVPIAYSEAMYLMEYKRILGFDRGIHFCDTFKSIQGIDDEQYSYSMEMDIKLVNAIKAGDFKESEIIIEDLFTLECGKQPTMLAAKCLMINIISTMMKTIGEMSVLYGKESLSDIKVFDRLLGCDNIVRMKEETKAILSDICLWVSNRPQNRHEDLIDRIKGYVEQNFNDFSLSVASIGEEFQMTPSYLSSIFKEVTGCGLVDYINKERIEKANHMLCKDDLIISEIATRVGYTSSNVFIRTYKKYNGITPGKYKKTRLG